MQNFCGNISRMVAIGITVFLLAACAATQSGVQPISKSANPTDVVNEFDGEVATALKNQLNVLSPDWFSKAETSLARAKKALSRGDEISEIMENVTEGRAQLKRAEEMAQVARTTLPAGHSAEQGPERSRASLSHPSWGSNGGAFADSPVLGVERQTCGGSFAR